MLKGSNLEKEINKINLDLRYKKKALIRKIAVPILATTKGLIAQTSTVDYEGLVNDGKYIAFDAKECESETAFPLSNIKQHQEIYLEFVYELGGYAFLLIYLIKINKYYAVPITEILNFKKNNSRKSIPFSEFKSEWECDINNYLEKIIKNEINYCNSNHKSS